MKPFFIWVSIPLEVIVDLPQKSTSKTITVKEKDTIGSVMEKLEFDLDTIIVLYNNNPIPETTTITRNMNLTVLEITSKG